MKQVKIISKLVICLTTFTIQAQAADYLSVGTAVDFSQGYYGAASKTDVIATVAQIKYKTSNYSLQMNLPYLLISGPSNSKTVLDSAVTTPTNSTQHKISEGIGDVSLGMTYNLFYASKYQLSIEGGFKLKLPTASHQDGLGTGQPDESLQLNVYKGIDAFTLIAGASYKWLGQTAEIKYRNVASATLGLDYQLSTFTSLGALVDFRESVFSELNNQSEITTYVTHKFSSAWNSQFYAYKGLTNSSSTFGVGASINYRF